VARDESSNGVSREGSRPASQSGGASFSNSGREARGELATPAASRISLTRGLQKSRSRHLTGSVINLTRTGAHRHCRSRGAQKAPNTLEACAPSMGGTKKAGAGTQRRHDPSSRHRRSRDSLENAGPTGTVHRWIQGVCDEGHGLDAELDHSRATERPGRRDEANAL